MPYRGEVIAEKPIGIRGSGIGATNRRRAYGHGVFHRLRTGRSSGDPRRPRLSRIGMDVYGSYLIAGDNLAASAGWSGSHHKDRLAKSRSRLTKVTDLDANVIVDGDAQLLLAAQIPLASLNAHVTEQELDLLQLPRRYDRDLRTFAVDHVDDAEIGFGRERYCGATEFETFYWTRTRVSVFSAGLRAANGD